MTRTRSVSRSRLLLAAALVVLVAAPVTVPWQLVAQEAPPAEPKQAAEAPANIQAEMRHQAVDQLMRLGLALHNYHSDKKSFPPPAILGANGKPLLSWRVAILPYLGEPEAVDQGAALYKQFDLTQPWDSPHNYPLVAKMPDVFKCPGSTAPAGMTVYLAPRGDSTVFPGPKGLPVRQITDGTSNTIGIVEVNDRLAVPWTKPDDWTFDPAAPAQGLGGHFKDVFLTLFCDGSAHALSTGINQDGLRALVTRNGREIVVIDDHGDAKVNP